MRKKWQLSPSSSSSPKHVSNQDTDLEIVTLGLVTAEGLESKWEAADQPRARGSTDTSRGGGPWCLPGQVAKEASEDLEVKAGGGS